MLINIYYIKKYLNIYYIKGYLEVEEKIYN